MPIAERTGRLTHSLVTFAAILALCVPAVRAVTVEITYTDGSREGFNDPALGTARQEALESAVSYWASRISGSQTIRIAAAFDPLGGTSTAAILGQAAPVIVRDFNGAPLPARWYPTALANQILGTDVSPATVDIVAVFNSSVDGSVLGSEDFYYGLDGAAGQDLDFVTVVLHELVHGLAFSSHAMPDGSWFNGYPSVYDEYVARGPAADADLITSMTASSRKLALTSGSLYFRGPQARTANAGSSIKLFAPSPYVQGSSTVHLDETTYKGVNELMTPFNSGTVHDSGPLVPAMMQDLGWEFIRPVNAMDQTVTTSVNTPVSITLEATGEGTLSFTITTPPAHGSLSGTGTSRIYTPATGYQGTDSFKFQASAGGETSNIATVTVNVGSPAVPTVSTGYADGISTSGSTLRGAVNPDGMALTAWFEWGETPALGNRTPSVNAGSGTASVPVSYALGSLTPGKTYFFRLAGSNARGTYEGEVRYFVTHVPASGTALAFDGVSDYLAINDSQVPETFTVEMWVKPAKTAEGQAFIAKHTTAKGDVFTLGYFGTGVYVRIGDAAYSGGVKTTDAHHLAVVVRKLSSISTDVTVYRNGGLLWQRSLTGATGGGTGRAWVVGQEWDGDFASDFFEGQVDEVRIWSTGRTQAQIQQWMHRRLAGTESGLRAYLRLDDGSGVTPREERAGYSTEMRGLPQWVPSEALIGIPLVTTGTTSSVTGTGARANGTVNPNGLTTEYWFEWGTSLSYGASSPVSTAGNGTGDVSASASITGLLAATTYHIRMVASNARGTMYGADQTFVTSDAVSAAHVSQALRVGGGLEAVDLSAMAFLNAIPESPAMLNIADAVRLARRAAGLDP